MRLLNEDLLIPPDETGGEYRLRGTECLDCGEVFFGRRFGCENCQSERLGGRALSSAGSLYSYTILRNRPPGAFGGELNEQGWLAVGLVELPDGVRVLSPLVLDDDQPPLGMPLALDLAPVDTADGPALTYRFRPHRAAPA